MSNKSSSFSSYYYTITDLLNATRIALAYCESNINPAEMITYDISDSSRFKSLIKVDKSDDGFVADIESWNNKHRDDPDFEGFKFNYVLVLGANDIIKAVVSIPDVIDVSNWGTKTITIEFNYNVTSEVLEYDIGTLVTVHISDSIREEVHKGLLRTGAAMNAYDIKAQFNPHQYFRNKLTDVIENDTIHYSGELCRYNGSKWNKINGDQIDISTLPNADIVKILDTKNIVLKSGSTYYINSHELTNLGDIKCISNSYIIEESDNKVKLHKYSLLGNSLTVTFVSNMKCRYFINSVNNKLIFYYDRTHYSKNFKVFELIDDSKSNRMINTELDSIRYITNVLYIKLAKDDNDEDIYSINSYLHGIPASIPINVVIDAFITDTLFIGHSIVNGYTEYYLYEDTVDGLKKYILGVDDYWYNIYLISKTRTSPHINTSKILTYKGLVYYNYVDSDNHINKLISI